MNSVMLVISFLVIYFGILTVRNIESFFLYVEISESSVGIFIL